MVSNRESLMGHVGDDGTRDHNIPIKHTKQKHGDPKQASVSGLKNEIKGLWTKDCELYFEHFLRRVVKEEVEHKMKEYLSSRPWANETHTSRATSYELRFINKLPNIIFTHCNMTAEDNTPIQVALFDVRDNSIVNAGPLSSIKVEICVLNGEFGFNGSEDWTESEFNANILRERDGKRPLLNGDRFVTLKNGIGCVNKVMFTDNSRWIRTRKFKLGVRVVQSGSNEANIKEGRSDPFVVKDYRGEAYKKHHPPSLNDDVWRLEQIAKDGKIHKRLSLHGIHNVKDLLRLYTTNPSLLEKVGNISKRSWTSIIEHAKTCMIDDEIFVYHTSEQMISLLFNSIYELKGVTFDGQIHNSLDTLTPNEKHLVEKLKQHAYKNVDNFKSIDETSLSCLTPLSSIGAGHSDTIEQGLQELNIFTQQEGHQGTWADHGQSYASTSYVDEETHNSQIYADSVPDITDMPLNDPYTINLMEEYTEEYLSELCNEGDSWVPHE